MDEATWREYVTQVQAAASTFRTDPEAHPNLEPLVRATAVRGCPRPSIGVSVRHRAALAQHKRCVDSRWGQGSSCCEDDRSPGTISVASVTPAR
jgi:hypothetical protein